MILKEIQNKQEKKTNKDKKKGKATIINLLGHKNTIKYDKNLKIKIFNKLEPYGKKSDSLKKTISFIINRKKWKKITNI